MGPSAIRATLAGMTYGGCFVESVLEHEPTIAACYVTWVFRKDRHAPAHFPTSSSSDDGSQQTWAKFRVLTGPCGKLVA